MYFVLEYSPSINFSAVPVLPAIDHPGRYALVPVPVSTTRVSILVRSFITLLLETFLKTSGDSLYIELPLLSIICFINNGFIKNPPLAIAA